MLTAAETPAARPPILKLIAPEPFVVPLAGVTGLPLVAEKPHPGVGVALAMVPPGRNDHLGDVDRAVARALRQVVQELGEGGVVADEVVVAVDRGAGDRLEVGLGAGDTDADRNDTGVEVLHRVRRGDGGLDLTEARVAAGAVCIGPVEGRRAVGEHQEDVDLVGRVVRNLPETLVPVGATRIATRLR